MTAFTDTPPPRRAADACPRTIVDGHVHVYSDMTGRSALDTAMENFYSLGCGRGIVGALLIADPPGVHFGARLGEAAESADRRIHGWRLQSTNEPHSLVARRGDDCLALVLGQQLATAEKLEVLSFGAAAAVSNRLPIEDMLAKIAELGGIAIVPWGMGKWNGRRGKLVERIVRAKRKARLYLGDNGGRPGFFPAPQLGLAESLGIRVLRGTDPLPVASDERRIGSFGFGLSSELAMERPLGSLIAALEDPNTRVFPLGRPVSLARAVRNQVHLHMKAFIS